MKTNMSAALKAIVASGVLIGVLGALPVLGMANCACCMWVIGGSILGSYLYRSFSGQGAGALRGMGIGFCGSLLGAVIFVLLSTALTFAGLSSGQLLAAKIIQLVPPEAMDQHIQQMERRIQDLPPEAQKREREKLAVQRKQLEQLRRGEVPKKVTVEQVIQQLVVTSMLYAVFGTLGGLLGGLLVPDLGRGTGAPAAPQTASPAPSPTAPATEPAAEPKAPAEAEALPPPPTKPDDRNEEIE